MGKFNCCVPKCTNNWRNSPNLSFHSLPKDPKVLAEYNRLIRNDNLCISSKNTKICGEHFAGGERICKQQLPTIFPWSKTAKPRREIIKHDVQNKCSKVNSNKVNISGEEVTVLDKENTDQASLVDIDMTPSTLDDRETCTAQASNISEVEELRQKLHSLQRELDQVKDKCDSATKEVVRLQYKLNVEPKFDICQHKDCDDDIVFFTGFPNYSAMLLCFDTLKDKAENLSYGGHKRKSFEGRKCGPKRKLTVWQEFTLILLRLRLGLLERDLAERFRIAVSVVSDITRTWIKFMKAELGHLCIVWPNKELLQFYMPPVYKQLYPDLVSIIDCTEIRMETPSSLDKQSMCYSSYKSHTTMKALVGITPNGAISFVSDLFSGSISDPEIVSKSGFLTHLNKGDLVMADKGFTIQDQLASVGAQLVTPNFLSNKGQFSVGETEHNKKIASLRIHVERCMERLQNWHFFDRTVPISTSSIVSDAFIVVACLSNFWPPIISE